MKISFAPLPAHFANLWIFASTIFSKRHILLAQVWCLRPSSNEVQFVGLLLCFFFTCMAFAYDRPFSEAYFEKQINLNQKPITLSLSGQESHSTQILFSQRSVNNIYIAVTWPLPDGNRLDCNTLRFFIFFLTTQLIQ